LKKRFIILLVLIFIIGGFSAFGCTKDESNCKNCQCEIVILHTNDIHGNIFPLKDKMDKKNPVGGMAYVATLIEYYKKKFTGRTLLIDAGDISQGTPVSNIFEGSFYTLC